MEAPKGGTRAGRAAILPTVTSPGAPDAGRRGSTPRLLAFLLLVSGALFLVIGAVGTLSYHVFRSPGSPASALDAGPRPEITPQDAGIAGDPSDADPAVELSDELVVGLDGIEPAAASASERSALLPLDADTPLWGGAGAPVTLLVFGDLACPETRRVIPVLLRLKQAFGADLRLAWKHLPLTLHPHAQPAAAVASAVHAHGGSSAFFKLLARAARGALIAEWPLLERQREALGLAALPPSASAADFERVVDDQLRLARQLRIRATPTLFINGMRVTGFRKFADLHGAIDDERRRVRILLATGAARPADAYAERVRKNLIGVGDDLPERQCVPLGGAPARGAEAPLVTIVEFGDFACSSCRQASRRLSALLGRHAGDLRHVWKNLPSPQAEASAPAALLAMEAFEQGGEAGFWRLHQRLLASRSLSVEALGPIAEAAGFDGPELVRAVRDGRQAARLQADLQLALHLEVSTAPTYFVNGRRVELAELARAAREELALARRLVRQGTSREQLPQVLCGSPTDL